MTIFLVVKNLACCNTQKKLKKLFMKYRHTILLKMRSVGVTTRPVVSCQNDLGEKLVWHFCAIDYDDMKEE